MNITFSISTDTRGIEQIIANCDSVTPDIIRGYAAETQGLAKDYAPYETGALESSIQWYMVDETTARIQPNVTYDIYQELGTWKMAAHPFLSPAIEMIAGRFLSPSTWSPLIYGGGYGVGAKSYYARQGGSHKASPSNIGGN